MIQRFKKTCDMTAADTRLVCLSLERDLNAPALTRDEEEDILMRWNYWREILNRKEIQEARHVYRGRIKPRRASEQEWGSRNRILSRTH
jgi:hypothetical protein